MRALRVSLGVLGALLAAALFLPEQALIQRAPAETTLSPPATQPAAPPHPPLGVNLEFVCDYARSMMFVDAIKSARKFGSADAPWDGKAAVDADGWPTGDAGTVVMAGVPVPPGDYLFSCTGFCHVTTPSTTAAVRALDYNRAANTTTAMIRIGRGEEQFFLGFKDTRGGVRNIQLLRPGYAAHTKEVFTKEFLAALAPFTTLRLMDLTRTNATHVKTWAERPHVTDALQSSENGVAWEYAILLANQAGKDLWINIPDQADDAYVKELAQLLKEKLNPDRKVYVEYSNEVWNSIFPQYGHNLDAAKQEVAAGNKQLNDNGADDNQYYWAWKRVPERLLQISAIFRGVWGDAAINTRILPVLASQSANVFMARTQVEFIAHAYGPPAKFIYGIAGAPYLGPGHDLEARDDLTLDDIFNKGFPAGFTWTRSVMLQYGLLARDFGLRSLCYEGATAIEGEHSLPVKIQANFDPRIQQVIVDYLNFWYSQGGDLFMYYNLAGTYSKYGCWGLTDDLRKITPKMKAILEVRDAPTPSLTAGRAIPATIPAWQFDSNSGGRVEPSGDGGKNVGFLSDGLTLDYLLHVPESGDYTITLRTATAQDGAAIELLANGQSLGIVQSRNTGTWQKYDNDPPLTAHLAAGTTVLRLRILKQPSNLRSITIALPGDKKSPAE